MGWVTQAVLAGENYRPGLWDEGYELEVGDRRRGWTSTTSDAQLWVVSALHLNLNGFALEWHLDVLRKTRASKIPWVFRFNSRPGLRPHVGLTGP